MSFEDKLREQFRRADASIPGERIDWSTTITKARRNRMKFAAFTTVAALSVLGIGAYAVVALNQDPAAGPITPRGSSSLDGTQPQPDGTASAREIKEVDRPCYASEEEIRYQSDGASLPQAVADMRLTIMGNGITCQFEFLQHLAEQGDPAFHYSFGVEESPARFWADREREAHRRGEKSWSYAYGLVRVLSMPHCKESQDDGTGRDTEKIYYVWPRVHCAAHRTDEDWNDLKGLYTDEQIEMMRESDLYIGFRVGILEDGDWAYFIAGD